MERKEREIKEVIAAVVANLAASKDKQLNGFQINIRNNLPSVWFHIIATIEKQFADDVKIVYFSEPESFRRDLEFEYSIALQKIKEAHKQGKSVLVCIEDFEKAYNNFLAKPDANATFIAEMSVPHSNTRKEHKIEGPMVVITLENVKAKAQFPKDGGRYDIETEKIGLEESLFSVKKIIELTEKIVKEIDLNKAVEEVLEKSQKMHPVLEKVGVSLSEEVEKTGVESEYIGKDEEPEDSIHTKVLSTSLNAINSMLYAWEAIGEKVDKELLERLFNGFMDEIYVSIFAEHINKVAQEIDAEQKEEKSTKTKLVDEKMLRRMLTL